MWFGLEVQCSVFGVSGLVRVGFLVYGSGLVWRVWVSGSGCRAQ